MAKYLVTSGSKFTPMDYSQMVQPLMQATEAHRETQAAFDELAANAESIGALISNSEGDKMARQLFDQYQQNLNKYVDELSANGYNANAMRGLSSLRRSYGKDITGIQNAIARRRELAMAQQEAERRDPSLISQYRISEAGLDNWLQNPEYGDYKSVSGSFIQQQVSKAAEAFKQTLTQRNQSKILGNQYFGIEEVTGATPQQLSVAKDLFAARIMKGDDSIMSQDTTVNELADIMSNAYRTSGIQEWGDTDSKAKVMSYISDGINSALGTSRFSTLQNRAWDYAMKNATSGGAASGVTKGMPYYTDAGTIVSNNNPRQTRRMNRDLDIVQKLIKGNDIDTVLNSDEYKRDTESRLHALTDIKNYFQNPDDNTKAAYESAIKNYPDYKDLTYVGGLEGMGTEFQQEWNDLRRSPAKRYQDIINTYGGGDSNISLGELEQAIHAKRAENFAHEYVYWGNPTNATNISEKVKNYLNGFDNLKKREMIGMMADRATDAAGNPANRDDAMEAIGNDKSKYAIDVLHDKIIVDSPNGKRFYFNTNLFAPFSAAFDSGAMVNYLTNSRQMTKEEAEKIFGIGSMSAPDAISRIHDYAIDNYGIRNTVVPDAMYYLWDGILKEATNSIPIQSPSSDGK